MNAQLIINSPQQWGHNTHNIMVQRTEEALSFTPELCKQWLNQLSDMKAQIMSCYDARSDIKCCIHENINEIESSLDGAAIEISELLKQQSLNDDYFEHKN